LATLAENVLSLSSARRWLPRFKESNISCEDAKRTGRPTIVIQNSLDNFLAKYPSASAKLISQHWGVRASSVKEISIRKWGARNILEDGFHRAPYGS
jgi:hypothetical protein